MRCARRSWAGDNYPANLIVAGHTDVTRPFPTSRKDSPHGHQRHHTPHARTLRSDSRHRPPLIQTRARRLTVGSLPAPWPESSPRPDLLPYLRMHGRWLEQAGFAVGAKIRVRVEHHRLILEVQDDPRREASVAPCSVHEPEAVV